MSLAEIMAGARGEFQRLRLRCDAHFMKIWSFTVICTVAEAAVLKLAPMMPSPPAWLPAVPPAGHDMAGLSPIMAVQLACLALMVVLMQPLAKDALEANWQRRLFVAACSARRQAARSRRQRWLASMP